MGFLHKTKTRSKIMKLRIDLNPELDTHCELPIKSWIILGYYITLKR